LRKERKKANLWERGSSLWLSLDRGGPLTAFSRCLLLPSSLHSGGSTVQFSDFFWIPNNNKIPLRLNILKCVRNRLTMTDHAMGF
jgi:hypothetical protein